MGYPKKVGYLPIYEMISHVSIAFTHPVRIQILKMLANASMTHAQICKSVPLCESTVSHHLRLLLELGLIEYKEVHPWIYYEIDERGMIEVIQNFEECMRDIMGRGV
jgi:ArsR family transcriptional regulator